jgi:hypothetical protein|tara:strand:- start:316 stop:438 length:123 start_codon:yes stop_codon:yes gene_type:complete
MRRKSRRVSGRRGSALLLQAADSHATPLHQTQLDDESTEV